jgi:ankyrin repeat protein
LTILLAPLMFACDKNHKEVAAFLLGKGANCQTKDNKGRTAVQIAESKPDVLDLLNGKNDSLPDEQISSQLSSMQTQIQEIHKNMANFQNQIKEFISLVQSM